MTSGLQEGHRILGDTAVSWFQKPAISLKICWGGNRRATLWCSHISPSQILHGAAVYRRRVEPRPEG